MKIKYKLSIMVIAIVTVIVTGIALLLLREASDISKSLTIKSVEYLADQQATYWKGREDARLLVLRTLADIMEDYEEMPAEIRRDQFDNMLLYTITSNPELINIYTVKTSIDKITKSTDNVLLKFIDIDSSVKTVADQEENIRNAMEEQSEGSKQVLEAISQVNETTQQVKHGSVEMLDGSKEVIRESQNLGSSTQEIVGGINEMATGADEINVAIHRVNELSVRNRENIDLVIREVSRFKVE